MALRRNLRGLFTWITSIWLVAAFSGSNFQKNAISDIPSPPACIDVTIVAVGDLISHQDVQSAARAAENGWASLWEEVTPLFKSADLTMVNLETPIAPKTGKPGVPFCFNASGDLAPALRKTGVDIVFTANNHAYDQGVKGVVETLEHLDAAGVKYVGGGLSRDAAESPVIIELRGGIKIAVLARTDIFNNNLNQRSDSPWVAALDIERDEIAVREIRQQVDVVIIGVHWGNEYHVSPGKRQREAAERLIAAGADIIAGHHPHVIQPFEWIESDGRKGAVAFSLGNFLSNQDRMYKPLADPPEAGDNRDGGAMIITLRKDQEGVKLLDARVEPLWTDNNWIAHSSGRDSRRVIRVLRTTPGQRGPEMESLLAKRRKHALERLYGD